MSRFVPFLLVALACGGDDDTTDTTDADADTDTDTDTDSDADADTDSDTDTDTDTDTPSTGAVTVDVDAAAGGEVATGDATLAIPAGALPADATITVEEVDPTGLADAATLASAVYDFGPDGLTFLTSATLSVGVAAAPPTGKVHVLSWYDDAASGWVDVPSSSEGLVVSGAVMHFTKFAVRLVDDVAECAQVDPCGGDPVGSWTMVGMCYDVQQTPPGCPTGTADILLDVTGTYNILADNTFNFDVTLQATVEMFVPPACLPPLPVFSCAMLNSDGVTCVGDRQTGCTCSGTTPASQDTGNGTWAMEGVNIVTDEGGVVESNPICIVGNTMWTYDAAEGIAQTFRR